MLTKNEAYLIAKRAWNKYKKKKSQLEVDQCLPDTRMQLRLGGYTEEDLKLVSSWIKAFRRGQRWPDT